MLVTPLQVETGVAKQIPQPQPKKKRKKAKIMNADRGYTSANTDGSAFVPRPCGPA
jgi:hypothetical protein